MDTAVATRPNEQTSVQGFEIAERVFTEERRAQIALFLNVSPTDPVLMPYLVTCATYGLSPIMGEIWLIPQRVKVRDGDAESMQNRYKPAVGRDGFLSIARRDARYRGLKGAVVCEHDSFEVDYDGSPGEPRVLHRFASKPTIFEEDGQSPENYRGRILGAWAKCMVEGQDPVFYFASLREHGKLEQAWEWGDKPGEKILHWLDEGGKLTLDRGVTGRPKMRWAGAWEYVSAMILKAAQSYVLRIGFGITGLAPADEMRMNDDALALQLDSQPQGGRAMIGSGEFDWSALDAPEELRERLRSAIDAANELAPMSWSAAKIEMVLLGRPVEELEVRAGEIEHEADLYSSRIDRPPSKGEPAAAASEPVGQVEEADQVARPRELTEAEKATVDGLRGEEADLLAAIDAADVGSEEHAAHLQQLGRVEADLRELDQRTGGGE